MRCCLSHPGIVGAERPGLAALRGSEVDRIEGAQGDLRLARAENAVRADEHVGRDRDEIQPLCCDVGLDLSPGPAAMHRRDRALPFLAQERRKTLGDQRWEDQTICPSTRSA